MVDDKRNRVQVSAFGGLKELATSVLDLGMISLESVEVIGMGCAVRVTDLLSLAILYLAHVGVRQKNVIKYSNDTYLASPKDGNKASGVYKSPTVCLVLASIREFETSYRIPAHVAYHTMRS